MLREEAKSDQQRRLMSKIIKTNTTVLLGNDCITGSGFGLVNFRDDNGKECSIQISSCTVCETEDCIIDNPRGWIWLGIDKAEPMILKTKGCELGLSLPPSSCASGLTSLPVETLRQIAAMSPDWVLNFLRDRSIFDVDKIETALKYASKCAARELEAEPIILKTKGCELGLSLPPGEVSGWMPYPVPDDVFINTRMHLNEAQVRGLIARLQTWLDTGAFHA